MILIVATVFLSERKNQWFLVIYTWLPITQYLTKAWTVLGRFWCLIALSNHFHLSLCPFLVNDFDCCNRFPVREENSQKLPWLSGLSVSPWPVGWWFAPSRVQTFLHFSIIGPLKITEKGVPIPHNSNRLLNVFLVIFSPVEFWKFERAP